MREDCHRCGQMIAEGDTIEWVELSKTNRRMMHGDADICVKRLVTRQDEHLALISKITRDSISPAERDQIRKQMASLIAEVGTLRAELRALKGEAPGA